MNNQNSEKKYTSEKLRRMMMTQLAKNKDSSAQALLVAVRDGIVSDVNDLGPEYEMHVLADALAILIVSVTPDEILRDEKRLEQNLARAVMDIADRIISSEANFRQQLLDIIKKHEEEKNASNQD